MAVSARKNYPYPEDEFDLAASSGGPEGVHRAEQSTARKVIPWIIVLVVIPAFAFGVVFYLSQNDPDLGDRFFGDDEEPAPTETTDDGEDGDSEEGADEDGEAEDGDDEDGADDEADEDGTDDDADEEDESDDEESSEPNYEAGVQMLNGTDIPGLASVGAERLEAAGFVNVAPDNYEGGDVRDTSVVKYADPDLKSTAESVASSLGIDDVVEDEEAGMEVMVVLWQSVD